MTTIIQNVTNPLPQAFAGMQQSVTEDIDQKLASQNFCFVKEHEMSTLLGEDLHEHWDPFRDSWNRLHPDTFMADGGTYRRRRHAIYELDKQDGRIALAVYRPHYQAIDHNSLNGGIARHFSPIECSVNDNPILIKILSLCKERFCTAAPACDWYIEVHQFRIETSLAAASPTPEGVHRDGVNFVFMMMVDRRDVSGGATFLYDRRGILLRQHTMTHAMESAFINDEHIYHGVSSITPAATGTYGYRDMLVITFRKFPAPTSSTLEKIYE